MELLICTKCKIGKEATPQYFPLHNKKANGLDSWCRSCRATYRSDVRRGKYRAMGCEDTKLRALLATKECAICNTPTPRLVVDHCHKTNRVRGVLCNSCNLGLGKFKDSPELLEAAMLYLIDSLDESEVVAYITDRIEYRNC